MNMTNHPNRARQSQIGLAYRAGREAMKASGKKYDFEVPNKFAIRGAMPYDPATIQGVLWHAFEAGKLREVGNISGASTMLRNARFCLRRVKA